MKPLTLIRGAWLVCACTLLCTLTLTCASPALGATKTSTSSFENTPFSESKTSLNTTGVGDGILRTIIALAIVFAVIYAVYWFLKQAKGSKNPSLGYGLEQIASLPMGTNRTLALVRVGAELHLLGISEHGITGIRVYSEEEAYELGLPLEGPDDELGGYGRSAPPIQRLVDTIKRFTMR